MIQGKICITIGMCFLCLQAFPQAKEFIAMEYVGGIGNRMLKVWVTDSFIFAAKVKGLSYSPIYKPADYDLTKTKELHYDPIDNINIKMSEKYDGLDFSNASPAEFLEIDEKNFAIAKVDIVDAWYNSRKKWGMGGYPHKGRIFIVSHPADYNSKRKREFILVGDQDGSAIMEWILSKRQPRPGVF